MNEPQGSSSSVSPFPLSGYKNIPLMIGSTLGVVSGIFIQSSVLPLFRPQQMIDFAEWKWLSEIKVELDHLDEKDKEKRIASLLLEEKERFHPKNFSKKGLLGKFPRKDDLYLSASAPMVPSSRLKQGKVQDTERGKLNMMHQFLAAKLLLALNATISPTQAATSMITTPVLQDPLLQRSFQTLALLGKEQGYYQPARRNERRLNQKRYSKETAKLTLNPEPVELSEVTQKMNQTELDSLKTLMSTIQTSMDNDFSDGNTLWNKNKDQTSATVSLEELRAQVTATQFGSMQTQMSVIQTSMDSKYRKAPSVTLFAQNDFLVLQDHPLLTTQIKKASLEKVNTQLNTQVAAQSSGVASHSLIQNSEASRTDSEPQIDQSQQNVTMVQTQPFFFEAFSKSQIKIENVYSEMKTQESADYKNRSVGWQLSSAVGHLPTLSWVNGPMSSGEASIPLIAEATLKSLGENPLTHLGVFKTNIQQANENGIVYIKIGGGWDVSFPQLNDSQPDSEFISKNALYFDLAGNYKGAEPYFDGGTIAFFNVTPGYNLLHLNLKPQQGSSEGQASDLSGAVAVPVLPGTMTYLDLTQPGIRTVTGKFLIKNNSSIGESTKVVSETVKIWGSEHKEVQYGEGQTFTIQDVLTFSNYPLFFEVNAVESTESSDDSTDGFTHRYQVLPSDAHQIKFIRNSVERIQGWREQVFEDVNDPNGIAIAYLARVIANHLSSALTPVIQPVLNSENFRPDLSYNSKVYSVSVDDLLDAPAFAGSNYGLTTWFNDPLQSNQRRTVAFGIPDGLMELKLINENHEKVWSTFFPSSSRVVNIFHPR